MINSGHDCNLSYMTTLAGMGSFPIHCPSTSAITVNTLVALSITQLPRCGQDSAWDNQFPYICYSNLVSIDDT